MWGDDLTPDLQLGELMRFASHTQPVAPAILAPARGLSSEAHAHISLGSWPTSATSIHDTETRDVTQPEWTLEFEYASPDHMTPEQVEPSKAVVPTARR